MSVNIVDEARAESLPSVAHDTNVRPEMTLIITAGSPGPLLSERVEAFKRLTQGHPTEIVVACDADWPDPPPGVRVLVTGAVSRGDKLDLASEGALGELLAFLPAEANLTAGWQDRAFELLRDTTVGAVGGPQLLPDRATNQQRAAWLVLSSIFGSGPLRYLFKRQGARSVPEMPTTNLVVAKRAFQAVGGCQSPSPLGDDARLCYKLRTLLGLRVLYDPELTVEASPPDLLQPFLSLMFEWGRQRGDLARRLPEMSRRTPYFLPAAALLVSLLTTLLVPFNPMARLGLLFVAGGYGLVGLWLLGRSRNVQTGLLAGAGLPLAHFVYASGFLRGYLGRSLGQISPGRFHQTPLRILIFNWRDITHPWAGGAESYMHQLGRRWVQAGCEVGWVSERYRVGKKVEVIDGIRIHRMGGHFTLYLFAALAYLLRLRNRYDVLVDCENGIPFFTPLFSHKPSVLVVHHLHREIFRRELPGYLRWLALWLEGWLMPRVYRHKSLVAVSQSTFSDLRDHGYAPERITIITNGVDLPPDPLPAARSPQPLLLYLGRLKSYKRVDVLLRAMPEVLERFPGAKLAIVGQGPERERLERLAWKLGLAETVRFHGYLTKNSRDLLLSQAWLAVCPSAFEGWGVVCLEANASGTPVVAARVQGLKDAVVDGITGVLVPYGSIGRLAEQLVTLLGDPDKRTAMGLAGRSWAAAHDWNDSAEVFLGKLTQLVEPQPTPKVRSPRKEQSAPVR